MRNVVVIGAGLAGLRACEGLRNRGYDGEIVLVGDEAHEPYDRPSLSKQFLSGSWGEDKVVLRKPEEIEALGLTRRRGPGSKAVALDVEGRHVSLATGEELTYDECIIATGARARILPGLEPARRVHVLRTIDDALRLRAALVGGGRLVIVGAGFVGMEVAATARGLGCDVTVVEPLAAPLGRVFGPELGRACARIHEAHGVELRCGTVVSSLGEAPGDGLLARLDDGGELPADAVLVGVGAVPNVDWLAGSGLEVTPGGVVCDATLRAAPGVTAAGDVALWPYGPAGHPVRLEHRTNAAEQGDHAAGTALGASDAYATVPYVWSDQYDVKIQVLGMPAAEDEWAVVDGDLEAGRAVLISGRAGRVTGAVGLGMPRALMQLRSAVAETASFEEARQAAV
jgi:3-phenylpropionate/trans-cinnamate dioxygenase ferredoxin reductase subunit